MRNHIQRFGRVVFAATLFAIPSLALADAPYTVKALLLEDDEIFEGFVTTIDNVAVNNTAKWMVECDTDNPNTDRDSQIVFSGVKFIQEGDPVPPAPAAVDSFDSLSLSNTSNAGWNFFLSGTPDLFTDSGIYFNAQLVIQESTISTAPQFSAGTPYIGWFDAKINDANQMVLTASVDDPGIATSVDRAIVVLTLDGIGALVSEAVIAKEGDVLAPTTEAITEFGTGPHQTAINNAGDVAYMTDLAGSTTTDGAIWRNTTLIAQEGSPSPIAGRNYEILIGHSVGLNDSGSVVFKANLDGATTDDLVIVRDGTVIAREGSSLPAIAPFVLESFGTTSGPVQIDNAGNVLWFGDWNDANADIDTGLFLNDRLLVQEGVTTVDGEVLDIISSGEDGFQISDNGQYIIFEGTLLDGRNGAFLISFCEPCDTNCNGTVNTFDIQPFIEQLSQTGPPPCSPCSADTNNNGTVNAFDIQAFLTCLGA